MLENHSCKQHSAEGSLVKCWLISTPQTLRYSGVFSLFSWETTLPVMSTTVHLYGLANTASCNKSFPSSCHGIMPENYTAFQFFPSYPDLRTAQLGFPALPFALQKLCLSCLELLVVGKLQLCLYTSIRLLIKWGTVPSTGPVRPVVDYQIQVREQRRTGDIPKAQRRHQ